MLERLLPTLHRGRLRRLAELLRVEPHGDDVRVRRAILAAARRGLRGVVLGRRRVTRAAATRAAAPEAAGTRTTARPRLVAVSWLEGDREVGDVAQWVNLEAGRAEVWRRFSAAPPHADRFGDRPRARVRFDQPGAHHAEVWLEADPNNVTYVDAETARNPAFVLDESHVDVVTSATGAVDTSPFRVPPAGLNRYRLVARDLDGNVARSGWLTAWRRLWVVPVHMTGLPTPDLTIARATHAAVGIDFQTLDAREIGYRPMVPSRLTPAGTVPEHDDLAVRAEVDGVARVEELGAFVKGVALVDMIAAFRDETLQVSVPAGGEARVELASHPGQSVPLVFRRTEDDREWLRSATYRVGHHQAPLPPENVALVPRAAADVHPGDFPLAPLQSSALRVHNPTSQAIHARLVVRTFAKSNAGFQTAACMVLSRRVNYADNTAAYIGAAAAHELGHGTYAAAGAEGSANPSGLEPHPFRYLSQGGHCHNPYSARTAQDLPRPRTRAGTEAYLGFLDAATKLIRASRGGTPTSFPNPACLMFGYATGTPDTLCPHCVRVQRKTDLSRGFAP